MTAGTLGKAGMLGSPFLFFAILINNDIETYSGRLLPLIFYLIYISSWMCSVGGLSITRSTGQCLLGRMLPVVQLIFLSLSSIFFICKCIDYESTMFTTEVLSFFWPLSNFYMIFMGIAVVVARRIRGWKCIVPLSTGLWFPLTILTKQLIETSHMISLIVALFSWLLWFLMGYVIYSTYKEDSAGVIRLVIREAEEH